jgi:hypothetical protein
MDFFGLIGMWVVSGIIARIIYVFYLAYNNKE